MAAMRVLYDGWPLIKQANSPAAIHLRTLLALAPEGVEALLALPDEASEDFDGAQSIIRDSDDLNRWQQRDLPRLARAHGADLIHTTLAGASLFGGQKTAISPAGYWRAESHPSRLGAALGRGGLARAHIFWPRDLPASELPGQQYALPPVAHPAFSTQTASASPALDLPDSYLLYHGAGDEDVLLKLFESWTWAAASIGEAFPLLLLGLDEERKGFVDEVLPRFHLEEYVQVLPELTWADLAAVFQGSSAVIAPEAPFGWGGSVRLALAAHKSVVAYQNPASEALLGPAAYLIEEGDLRGFGAAMITVVVDEKMWERLEEEAGKRAAGWEAEAFRNALAEAYARSL